MCFGVGRDGGVNLCLRVAGCDLPCPAAVSLAAKIKDLDVGAVLEGGHNGRGEESATMDFFRRGGVPS